MPSVAPTPVAASAGTWENMGLASVAELVGWEVLVSNSPGLVEDADSEADQVVSEEPANDSENLDVPTAKGVTTGEFDFGVRGSADTEECVSAPELVVPTLVSAV